MDENPYRSPSAEGSVAAIKTKPKRRVVLWLAWAFLFSGWLIWGYQWLHHWPSPAHPTGRGATVLLCGLALGYLTGYVLKASFRSNPHS